MRSLSLVFALAVSQILPFAPVLPVSADLNRRYATPTTRSPAVPDTLALRQHKERRGLLDVCAYIDLDVGLGINILGIPTSELAGLKICLCLSALPLDLDATVQLKALGDRYGADLVNAVLSLLINTGSNSKHCTYPDNCDPFCSSGDPCGFQCHPPYVKQGDKCVCPPPYVSCNGKCVPAYQGCGSAVPYALAARSDSHLIRAQASCRSHETVCGVFGSADSSAFECVDTDRDLESCGGCMAQNPFTSSDTSAPAGRDCTSIAGVDSVTCIDGGCTVQSCLSGWAVNGAKDGCDHVPTSGTSKHPLVLQPSKRKSVFSRLFVDPAGAKDGQGEEGESHEDSYASAFYRD